MEALMFVRHHQGTGDVPCELVFTAGEIAVQSKETSTNAITETENRVESRPVFVLLWDLGMVLVKDEHGHRANWKQHTWQWSGSST